MSIPPPPNQQPSDPQFGGPQFGGSSAGGPPQGVPPQSAPPQGGQGAPPPGPGAGSPGANHSGAPGHGYGPQPGRKMKRWGQGLTWTGLAITVVGIIAAIVTGVIGFGNAVPSEDRMTTIVSSGTVTAEADEDLYLYVPDGAAPAVCTVYPPGQAEVHPIENPINTNFTHEGAQYQSNGGFTTTEAGTYELTCSNPEVLVAPSVSGGAIAGGVLGVVGGSMAAVVGGLILIIGIILWIVGAKRMKKSGVR